MTHLVSRKVPSRQAWQLEQQGLHPLLARLYAARGIGDRSELDYDLKHLLPPASLTRAEEAAALLADAIEAGARLLIVADYDCDGATACAVGLRALRGLGATVESLVPDRFKLGYGLSPEIVDLASRREPDLIITVDNGIASIEGVARAQELGIAVLITDHHLPGEHLPDAECIVNPNQPGCGFASKAMAGCGVMFYVMLALRAELRRRNWFADRPEPNLGNLLDLVALGTVADVVRLDRNNRILVSQGLARMRQGRLQPGLAALFAACGRDPATATAFDLGFVLGPRLNAAGRLADMGLGIECLTTDDPGRALAIAQQLDALNRERREIEAGMQAQALELLDTLGDAGDAPGVALFDPAWHEGVVGILAARLKDRLHRPVFAFARGESGLLKGSGRSIPGLHLRDALDLIAKRAPGLLLRFGGHAMAAGATLREDDYPRFSELFATVASELLDSAQLTRTLETDGSLESGYLSLEVARLLEREIWGQGFPPPLFLDEFEVEQQKILKEKHLKMKLRKGNSRIEAIQFNYSAQPGARARIAFRLAINEFMGVQSPQLTVEYLEPRA
ncbi:MAG: single-stranded-DNA-specific exonuclease RecJ [Betaproteobacteria bacterium]|jgi:single-stranded-DNA-specific exonuclease|nr:single-stranded-DNA-specific exonuclease RecJ [Betaproteobacteria bacterium]HMV20104.1 single-stranded-DNA-specific exonuclease RecJ [Rhodocyclaceae bacterium]HMW77739.1 single-stranded-DNA-specific exonuclease RecJ [Rhodocyclaceae bacterium]HNM21096.1 single-stranded-DNA-specific exonuclease RecJ [Rhodocyclaceae bacterium]HNM82071.1 single-stranded-DNA-specific exonuclease RecJ [Rhodocyclaceae bacterium]